MKNILNVAFAGKINQFDIAFAYKFLKIIIFRMPTRF